MLESFQRGVRDAKIAIRKGGVSIFSSDSISNRLVERHIAHQESLLCDISYSLGNSIVKFEYLMPRILKPLLHWGVPENSDSITVDRDGKPLN